LTKSVFYNADRRSLTRNIICILTPKEKASRVEQLKQSDITLAKDKSKEMLASSIEKLSIITDQIFPSINLDILTFYTDNTDIRDGIALTRKTSESRACIYQLDIVDTAPSELRKSLGISHLIAIQLGRRDLGWSHRNGISSVMVETTVDKLAYLIHDIILDIVMFHSWAILTERYGASIEGRIEISRKKGLFAQERGLTSYYGPIQSPQIEYFCFASHCRQGGVFSYEAYEELWKDFIQSELLEPYDGPAYDGAMTIDRLVELIVRNHRQGGQISKDKLRRQLAQLPPGTYLLLMTRKKPYRIKVRLAIAREFGRKSWRQSLWKIVSFKDYKNYMRAYPFVSFFKFTVKPYEKEQLHRVRGSSGD
jgi:hypothetical protein